MNIVYAKNFRFPNHAANYTQGTAMAAAFAEVGAVSRIYATMKPKISQSIAEHLQAEYAVRIPEQFIITTSAFRGVTGYNAGLQFFLLRKALCGKSIFFTREVKEALFLLQLSRIVPGGIRLFHEVHDFKYPNHLQTIFTGAQGIVFIHKDLKEKAKECYTITRPCCVAPSGFQPSIFYPLPARQENSNIIRLGYVGGITLDKGAALLVEMLCHLPEHVHMKIVGQVKQPDIEGIQALLRTVPQWEQRITVTGLLPHAQVASAMQDMDIMVIPSHKTDMFLSQIKTYEALACGVPIVATPLPHLKNVLHNHALLSESVTGQSLAHSVLSLWENAPLRAHMRKENPEYARNFSWQARAQKLVGFFKNTLIENSGKHHA